RRMVRSAPPRDNPHLPLCYPRRVATHFANSVGQLTERQYDEHRSRDGPDPFLQPADHRNRFVFARLAATDETRGFQFELNDPFQPIF
ncbi:hypothetical protein ACQKJ1_28195, partial [Methylorubrum rhodesianum]|uniref:hypothetical protein n=1 Tax=Methylorubrum rhodesianum TaxID=29427 RepID=UPI003D0254DA